MIVVIADDFTGAAELAGIGIRYGMRTEVWMGETLADQVELLVIATDTRSMRREEAVEETLCVGRAVLKLRPEWVYKKTDSVLRGHVVSELSALMEVLGMEKTLLAPANPALGRTISGGRYYINGVPIHETSFYNDPEFPVRSPEVREMLGGSLDERIVVGNVEAADDLYNLARSINEKTLAAGGAEFFRVLLGREEVVKEPPPEMRRPVLFVSGTAFKKSQEIKNMIAGWPREKIAAQVRQALSETTVRELVIEGGSTAYAVLRAAGLKSFVPVEELAPGVVRMRAGEMYITVKPGSYAWPEKLLTI